MLRSLFFLSLGFLSLIFADPARAEKRVALVIGISNYQQVPRLANPVRDAEAIAGLFKKAGFDVVDEKRDLGIADMRRVVREFSEKSRDADIAVVYYAGHGIEVDGTNYLVPSDAKLVSDFDVEDETVSLDRVIRALDSVKRLKLIILDACRDNPFATTMKRSVVSRSVGRGLGKIEPAMSDTLIAFAAKAGAVASDGDGQNSPFATALVKYITEPGLDLRLAFGRVRDDVSEADRKLQRNEGMDALHHPGGRYNFAVAATSEAKSGPCGLSMPSPSWKRSNPTSVTPAFSSTAFTLLSPSCTHTCSSKTTSS